MKKSLWLRCITTFEALRELRRSFPAPPPHLTHLTFLTPPAAALSLCFLCLSLSASAADPRPNIVWIFGEDMGPELGCYGDTLAITPNMDKLASQGARFTSCFTDRKSTRLNSSHIPLS